MLPWQGIAVSAFQIYNNEISRSDAVIKFRISESTARDYMRLYRDVNGLPPKNKIQKDADTVKICSHSPEPDLSEYRFMTKDELIQELVNSRINEARLKRIRSERSWCGQNRYNLRQLEYEIIMELSGEFPVQLLCETMGIQRSSFYHWKKRLSDPAPTIKTLTDNVILFREYHIKYLSHGYRWLNAKIKLNVSKIFFSDFGLFYKVPQNSGAIYSTTNTIGTYVYRALLQLNNPNMSAAAGFYKFIVGFVLVLTVNALMRQFSRENALF